MKPEKPETRRPDRTFYNRLKPFTIVGAAMALGLIAFDPDEALQAAQTEQSRDDAQPVNEERVDTAEDLSGNHAEAFRLPPGRA